MLTAEQVTDRCSDNQRPTAEEIAGHFRDTIFWNWSDSVANGLNDQSRIDGEFPLTVSERSAEDDGREFHLRFECGECSIGVGLIYETDSDETAREVDAHFVANLPVYIPALFRQIAELERQLAEAERRCGELEVELAGTDQACGILRAAYDNVTKSPLSSRISHGDEMVGAQRRIAQLEAQLARQWQPIETAPQDFAPKLLWPGMYVSYCWLPQYPKPTHWQPLPQPPASEETSDG